MQTFNNGQKSKEIQSSKVEVHVSIINGKLITFLKIFSNIFFNDYELELLMLTKVHTQTRLILYTLSNLSLPYWLLVNSFFNPWLVAGGWLCGYQLGYV